MEEIDNSTNIIGVLTCIGTLLGGFSSLAIAIIAYRKWWKKEKSEKNTSSLM